MEPYTRKSKLPLRSNRYSKKHNFTPKSTKFPSIFLGRVVSLYDGEIPSQKIILCRDQKGPILRVIYYNTTHLYEDVAEITLEMLLRLFVL